MSSAEACVGTSPPGGGLGEGDISAGVLCEFRKPNITNMVKGATFLLPTPRFHFVPNLIQRLTVDMWHVALSYFLGEVNSYSLYSTVLPPLVLT